MSDFKGRCLKVFELTSLIKETLESQFYSVLVEGEVSNFKPSSTGHYYFSLKDSSSMISAVLFKNAAKNLVYLPADGELVRVTGDVSVYPQRGSYQIICHTIEKAGEGEILARLEKLKKLLASEGLFDEAHKKKLPLMPKRIGVVTSPTGAAIKDILRVLKRRNNRINLIVLPAPVQGDDAARLIAAQIRRANMLKIADVLIVGRGGGSLEDLLAFSSEEVVRAIYESEIPVISAVGHEIDVSLSDFAADLKAPTPSAAAEIVSVESDRISTILSDTVVSISSSLRRKIEILSLRLGNASPLQMERLLKRNLNLASQRLDDGSENIRRIITDKLKLAGMNLALIISNLNSSSPEEIFKKGYAAVFNNSQGHLIKSAFEAKPGDEISVRFLKDILKTEAKSAEKIESVPDGSAEKGAVEKKEMKNERF
ncbi:MAG: exodeoxyribonuclease VII large subunit [Spirochaetia bacterium]|jgi:exodeoxyribonuclease VII large subunit|nr:exodeoxyribonuclease VII large subunit [Spirochaetia bacterium]